MILANMERFIKAHPGCTVTEVAEGLGIDNATAWLYLSGADEPGSMIVSVQQPPQGKWRFMVVDDDE